MSELFPLMKMNIFNSVSTLGNWCHREVTVSELIISIDCLKQGIVVAI